MRILFLLLCHLCFVLANAQFSTVSTQSVFLNPTNIYPTPDNGFLQLTKISDQRGGRHWKKFRYELTLLKYDSNGTVVNRTLLKGGKDNFSALFADLIISNNKFWVVYIEPSEGTNVNNVKAMEIDPITLESKEEKTLATKDQINEKISAFGGFHDKTIFLKSSPGRKFHLLMVDNNERDFYLSCLDENLTPLWQNKITIPGYTQRSINSYTINDNGSVYLASLNNKGALSSAINTKGKTQHQSLDFGALTPTDIQLASVRNSDKIVVSGFYGKDVYCQGTYNGYLDNKTLSVQNLQQTAFPDSMLQRLKKDGFASVKSKKYGIHKWDYRSELIEQGDGNLVMITELNARLGSVNIQAKGVGSLITTHFTPSTAIFSHIPRYAVSNNHYENREYFAMSCLSTTFLFYWDERSNLSKTLQEEQTVLKGAGNAVLVAAEIDNNGLISRKAVLNGDSGGGISSFFYKECR